MREREWSSPRPRTGRVVERPGLAVDVVSGLGQTLVSGAMEPALAALAPGAAHHSSRPHLDSKPGPLTAIIFVGLLAVGFRARLPEVGSIVYIETVLSRRLTT